MKRVGLVLTTIVMLFTLCGCKSTYQDGFIAMDAPFTLSITGKDAKIVADEIETEIKRLEKIFSVTDESSEISLINKSDSAVKVSEETAKLIARAKEISQVTDGCFDVSVYPIVELWGFTKDQNKVPTEKDIAKALLEVDYKKIDLKKNTVTFNGKIDLGGIAKGYACDRALEILNKYNVEKAIVSSGSSILLKGGEFRVGIQHPVKSDELICVLKASDTNVVTSGGYQRNFEKDGKVYHHIIDTKTGKPAGSGIISATVICKDGTLADGLSTALYVMGVDKATELYKKEKSFDMILVTETDIYSTLDIEVSDNDYNLHYINKEDG